MKSMKEANFPGQIRMQHIKLKARMMFDELLPWIQTWNETLNSLKLDYKC
jgi:hypothetical protein